METTSLTGTLPRIDPTPNQKASNPKDGGSSIHRHERQISTVHVFVTQFAGPRNTREFILETRFI